MQRNFKIALVALTVAVAASPFVAVAERPISDKTNNGFCVRLTTISTSLTQQLAKMEENRTQKRDAMLAKTKQDRTQQETKVKQLRTDAETKLQEAIDEMQTQTDTAAAKQAVTAFRAAVKSAQETRKASVDAAHQSFRSEADKIITARQTAIKAAADTFKHSVKSAIAQAKTDCANEEKASNARITFMQNIKTAKDAFKMKIEALDKTGAQIKTLTKVRNEAIRKANREFKDKLRTAHNVLNQTDL